MKFYVSLDYTLDGTQKGDIWNDGVERECNIRFTVNAASMKHANNKVRDIIDQFSENYYCLWTVWDSNPKGVGDRFIIFPEVKGSKFGNYHGIVARTKYGIVSYETLFKNKYSK